MLSVLIHSALALVAAVVVLLGPGLLCTRALRLRGLPALATATGLTCTIVGAAATLTTHGVTPLRWSLPLLIAATAVSALVAYGIGRLLPAPPARDGHLLRRAAAIGTGVGTLSLGLALFLSIRRLDAVVAQPDANYHLNSIRSILLHGDASSLDGGVFLYDRPHSYYPSTFHAIAASASQLTGLQPVFVANAVSVICGSLIWTLGCVLLCRQAFGRNGAALIAGGVAASTFVAMPFWIAGYGPLWPLVLGYAVVPGLIACLLSLLGLAQRDTIGRPQSAVLLVTTAGGLGFVHPAALATVVLIAYPLGIFGVVRWARTRSWAVALPSIVAAVVALPLIWWAATREPTIRGFAKGYAVGPTAGHRQAAVELLTSSAGGSKELVLTSIVVVIGLLACLWNRRLWWAVGTYLLLTGLYFCVAAVSTELTRLVTVFWYNERPRVAALIPLGRGPGPDRRAALADDRPAPPQPPESPEPPGHLGAGRDGRACSRSTWSAPWATTSRPRSRGSGSTTTRRIPTRALLPLSRQPDLITLARSVPRDAIVAVNPWRGHALLYAFGSRQVAFYSEKAVTTPDRQLVADQLYLAGTPSGGPVCGAVRRLGISYVLTGGSNFLPNSGTRSQFTGIDLVPGAARIRPDRPIRSVHVVADHGLFVTRGTARRSGDGHGPDGY